jgi:truncated hemoglobin YjbI
MQLYETLPDKSIIRRVNEIFYRKVYEHPCLSLFFQAVLT